MFITTQPVKKRMALSKREIRHKVEDEGAIHVLITFEMVGKPKEHVDKTLQIYIEKLEEDPNVEMINKHTGETIELEEEEGFFSSFCEVEMLIPNIESLTSINVNLMPASVEVLAPDEFRFTGRQVMNWQNDLLARLHEISQNLREERQKVAYMAKNTQALIQNMITILLSSGPKSSDQLSKLSGIEKGRLEKVLEEIKKQEVIKKEEGSWQLIPNKK